MEGWGRGREMKGWMGEGDGGRKGEGEDEGMDGREMEGVEGEGEDEGMEGGWRGIWGYHVSTCT